VTCCLASRAAWASSLSRTDRARRLAAMGRGQRSQVDDGWAGMNYFAHALPFLDRPYFVAGTAVPDWLAAADRGARVRPRQAERLAEDPRPHVASVAQGVLQHIRDDRRFHQSRVFAELSLELTAAARQVLGAEAGFQSSFLGHLLVEVLLDAWLAAEDPARVEAYYAALACVDPLLVQQATNGMASRPTSRLAPMIAGFRRERILRDYLEDGRLLVRLSQVMHRVGMTPLPGRFRELLPKARRLVEDRQRELLEGIPARDVAVEHHRRDHSRGTTSRGRPGGC
jgi:hypothetical protein